MRQSTIINYRDLIYSMLVFIYYIIIIENINYSTIIFSSSNILISNIFNLFAEMTHIYAVSRL